MNGRECQNFGPLSKNAVSYSSPSKTTYFPLPSLKVELMFLMKPPTNILGSNPAVSRIQATIAVVVVLPCVPAITIAFLCCLLRQGFEGHAINSSRSISDIDR